MGSTNPPGRPAPAQLWMSLLGPDQFASHPEIAAVLQGGPPLTTERAKEITTALVDGLRDHLPKIEAVRSTLHAMEELLKTMGATAATIARDDAVLLSDPPRFITPDQELAHRVSRIARQIMIERDIVTAEDTAAIVPEAYQRAREAMGERGSLPTMETQDVAPIVFLRLRQVFEAAMEDLCVIYARTKGPLEQYLELSLFPRLSGGRPSLDLSMFFAWLLQDATTRGMTDERVAVFLQDAFASLSGEWGRLAPSVSTVAKWRQERERIPEIPHHGRPHKRR